MFGPAEKALQALTACHWQIQSKHLTSSDLIWMETWKIKLFPVEF